MLFKDKPLEDRVKVYMNLMAHHAERIPVLLYPDEKCSYGQTKNEKLLVSPDYKVANLLSSLRDEFTLEKDQAFYIFAKKKKLVQNDQTLSEIYGKNRGEDGFLTLYYSDIKSFGASQ